MQKTKRTSNPTPLQPDRDIERWNLQQQTQRRQELPSPLGARFADACAPALAGTASLDQGSHHSRSAGMASLVVHTPPERHRRVAVHTPERHRRVAERHRPVAHKLEPSVARMEQALAVTDRSYMLERHCHRAMTAGRGGRGGDGAT
jgi:hypothetical protein